MPLVGFWVMPSPRQWLWLAAAGVCATSGQLLVTRGYAHAPAAQVGPFHYTAVLFATLYGWWLWGERMDRWVGCGALMVCMAGIMATRGAGLPPAAMFGISKGR